MNNEVKLMIDEACEVVKSELSVAIQCEVNPDGQNTVPLGSVMYSYGESNEEVMFELIVSDDGKSLSLRVDFCEIDDLSVRNCWDVFCIPPSSLNITTLLRHVLHSSKEDCSLLIDLSAVVKLEEMIKGVVGCFKHVLRK